MTVRESNKFTKRERTQNCVNYTKIHHYFHKVLKAHIVSITENRLSIHYNEYKSDNLKKALLGCKRTSDFE